MIYKRIKNSFCLPLPHRLRVILIIILPLFPALHAQIVIHKNLNINDGMVYSQVTAIHKDQEGYMWFGTSSGLSRWDGHAFKNYIFPENLSDNNCKWIAELSDGPMYIATRKNVIKYADHFFSKLKDIQSGPNTKITGLTAVKNTLYVGTNTSGLWIIKNQQSINLNKKNGLQSDNITALAGADSNTVYFTDDKNILYKYKDGKLEKTNLQGSYKVNSIFKDRNNILWIGTVKQGLFFIKADSGERLKNAPVLKGYKINSVSSGADGDIYAATNDGFAVFKNYQLQSMIKQKQGLSAKFIWQVYYDRSNIYYIATDGGGVDIYRPGLFETIDKSYDLPCNEVWAICEDAAQNIYIGTTRGIAVYKPVENGLHFSKILLPDKFILALHYAADGVLYAATNEHGVYAIKRNKIVNIDAKKGLSGNSVWSIDEDVNGLLYFGVYGGGLNIWDGKKIIKTLTTDDGLPSNEIVSSYRSADGSLYFGTDGGGVFKYSRGVVDTVLLPGNTIWSAFEDEEKNLYFATDDKGMIYYKDGKWDTLSVRGGLSHNSILGIMQGGKGKYYLTTDNGLNSVDFGKNPPLIINIGSKDGLAGDECNQGAYYKDSKGSLWVGTINGVSRYNPSLIRPDSIPPKIILISIRLYNKELLNNGGLKRSVFSYNENYFKFEYTGIELIAPHNIRYKYRLAGLDDRWMITNHNMVQYTNLKNNDYRFEVMAGNMWGYWSKPVSFSFTIEAPYWKSWWFIFLIILVIAVPSVIIARQRFLRLLVLQKLRAKIAADLHDDIGAGLSEISILSAVIPAKAPPHAVQYIKQDLEKIGQTSRSIIDKMSDIVWMVNPHKDAVSGLINHLTDSFADIFEAKGIQFNTENIEILKQKKLKMEYRQQLFMIFKEAIHNAVKYSGADKITLSVAVKGKNIKIVLRDNGIGIKDNRNSSGNGINNMKRRAADINGRLNIKSQENEGTTVEFIGLIK